VNDYLTLLLGMACAGAGGELFVRGAVGLAHWARISPGIIGATVAAFATSSPELSVSINSALEGNPEIALGNALGSNIVNVALILGLALVVSGIQSPRDSIKRDFPVAVLVPVLTGVLFLDGVLSRVDGLVLLSIFFAWIVATILEARKQRSAVQSVLGEPRRGLVALSCLVGLALLVAAGELIVAGAKGIAVAFGVGEFLIGATVVAIGTTAPELATMATSKFRGHDEIGLGTLLGSNIFNGMFVVAIAAIIHPIIVPWREVATALAFGLVALAVAYPPRTGFIERRRGVLLLMLYVGWLATILQSQAA
jgi:cation:H+ antiporter